MQKTVTISEAQSKMLTAIAQRRDQASLEYSTALTMAVAGQFEAPEGTTVVSAIGTEVTLEVPEKA